MRGPGRDRERLLERLDLYGVRRALAVLADDPEITAGKLRRVLLDCSGLAGVRARLDEVFRARADGIKAAAALASVTALAQASGDPASGSGARRDRGAAEQAGGAPAAGAGGVDAGDLRRGAVAGGSGGGGAADRWQRGSRLPLGMAGRPRHELVQFALERASWWRSFASFGATPAQSRVAFVVHRAYFLIWQQLQAGQVPAPAEHRRAASGGDAAVRDWLRRRSSPDRGTERATTASEPGAEETRRTGRRVGG
ncbi:hypothetical protein GCM10020366_09030 [Saccharopolyspora gregorii]|uniref:DUF3263 domain-containing protein n=1 Tax=Saccharopolyspora gregorii TaxID=33914 RepID=A0ABP6RK74_9PSEU